MVRKKISEVGGYCSILVLVLLFLKFLTKVYQLLSPVVEELQALIEENHSASAMPVARKRNLNPEDVDFCDKVKEADSQQDAVVEYMPPHPQNWLKEM